jgi:hypothetical protein
LNAYNEDKLQILEAVEGLVAPFEGSVFTTADFSFGDIPDVSRKDNWDVFHTWRAMTCISKWDSFSNRVIIPRDNHDIPFPPGSTLLMPTAVKRYFFTSTRPGDKCYLFQQYFNAGADRWVD